MLLENNAAVSLEDANYLTPLHMAAIYAHSDAVQALVTAKAALDPKDTSHQTPLHYAAWNGNSAALQVLLTAKAAVDTKDSASWTQRAQRVCWMPKLISRRIE